jgi:hypothetical protein
MASPTARTLNLLRKSGFQCAVIEKWNAYAGIRQDVWGFADVIASHPIRQEIFLIQVTTASNLASRLAKAKGRPELAGWLRSGGRVQFHGWAKRGAKWQVRIVELVSEDLALVPVQKFARRGRRAVQRELFAE